MRKTLWIVLLLLVGVRSSAQTTAVSATVTDSDSIAWNNLTFVVTFQPLPGYSGQYTYQGSTFIPQQYSGNANSSGTMNVTIPDNSFISPAGTKWQFVLQPYASAQSTQFTIPVTGATQDFTTLFSSGVKAPRFSATPGAFGYSTVEVSPTPQPGGQFFNVTLGCMETWSGSAFACNSGGGGSNPAGNNGDVQIKNGANLAASGLNENSGVLTNGDQNSYRGPNPSVDITNFNARAVSTSAIPLTTGTITGGTNSLTVASNSGWQKNDGFALQFGGATNCGTPPVAPTGFAGLASSMPGTGHAVAGATGSTSYSYVAIGLSQGGCWTAASPILTISNGNSTLGATNIPITSCANSAGTVTCTVGSTTGLATGMWVRIGGTTDDGEFGSWHNITVLNGTQFTYSSNVSSVYPMFSTTATGGTLYYFVENSIALPALPAGTNMYKEALYRCTGASCALPANAANYSLIYVSYPLNLGFIDSAYGKVDDYGSVTTVTIGQSAPWYLPSTPPATNVNDMLVTTITGISGTTFTLAANATNTVTNTSCNGGTCSLRFDNVPAITAAQSASNTVSPGGGGAIRFPPPLSASLFGTTCYVTSSYLVLNTVTNMAGPPCTGETVELSGNRASLTGMWDDTIHSNKSSFDNQSLLTWSCLGGNPCIWRKGPQIRNLLITTSGPGENLIFDNSTSQTLTENVHFNIPDGMGIAYHAYEATFGAVFNNTSWTNGPSQVIGAVAAPTYINRDSIQTTFNGVSGSLRGLYWECTNNPPNSCAFYINVKMSNEWQGPITPLVTVNATTGGRYGWIWLEHMIQDSGAESIFVNASNAGSQLASLVINGTDQPFNGQPIIGGNPIAGGVSLLTDAPLIQSVGMNHDIFQCPQPGMNQPNYRGCQLPSLNLATATYGANHTLNASEGIVKASASGITFTLPHALAGQTWQVLNPTSGTITLTIDSGTLSGNQATGPITVPANSGGVASCDGVNCSALGFGGGGGGAPGGTTNAIQYNGGGGSFGAFNSPTVNGSYLCGFFVIANASVSPTCPLTGVPINPQTGTTYVEGSANPQSDRAYLTTANNAGAQTYTMGNPSAAGFGSNYFNVLDVIGAGAVTENASGFTVNGGSSFLTPASWLRWLWSDGVNYRAEAVPTLRAFPSSCTTAITVVSGVFSCGSAGSVSSWSGDGALYNNVNSTGAVVATLATAGANRVWGNCTTSTGTPSYCQITDAMLTAISHAALFNISNVWTSLQDFSGATWKLPASAGFTAGASSQFGLDTTNRNIHGYVNNADSIIASIASTPTNNDCAKWSVSSGTVQLADAGAACGSGGGGGGPILAPNPQINPLYPQIVYNTPSASSAANISATNGTMISLTNTIHQYKFEWVVSLTVAGTSCSSGSTTFVLNAISTNPSGGGSVTTSLGTITLQTGAAQGTVGLISSGAATILAAPGTAVQYSTSSFTAGTGCSPAPSYQVQPTLVQEW